ncbi:hypothetical protein B0H13DRAFT_1909780 [Mycena leptocephala]|nr:hypothetical protein B0H13DRAFT_1909780 [Mycena leptocephala]
MNYGPPTHAAAYAKLLAPENYAAPTEADDEVVQMARGRLMQDLSELRTQQGQHVPELAWLMKDINVEQPEKEALFLPSDYSATALQPLLREHIWGKLKDGKVQVAGQVKESNSWFWRVGRPSTLSQADEKNWNRELDRVKWFRLRALLERAKKEHDILDEEFDSAWQSFHRSAAAWKSMAAETETERPGRKAYGEKQYTMYHELVERCFIARGTHSQKCWQTTLKKSI